MICDFDNKIAFCNWYEPNFRKNPARILWSDEIYKSNIEVFKRHNNSYSSDMYTIITFFRMLSDFHNLFEKQINNMRYPFRYNKQ